MHPFKVKGKRFHISKRENALWNVIARISCQWYKNGHTTFLFGPFKLNFFAINHSNGANLR